MTPVNQPRPKRGLGPAAIACFIIAAAALTRSPDVVVWTAIVLFALWLGSYGLTNARDALHARWARHKAQTDADWAVVCERQRRLSRSFDEAVLLGNDASPEELEFATSVWADIDDMGGVA